MKKREAFINSYYVQAVVSKFFRDITRSSKTREELLEPAIENLLKYGLSSSEVKQALGIPGKGTLRRKNYWGSKD